jgi:NitT/TauT family transport system substrate-binding protein
MRRSDFLAIAPIAVAAPSIVLAQDVPLRVASTAGSAYAAAYIAEDKGFFKAANLPVDLTILNNGGSVAAAIAGGAYDIGITSPMTLAVAIEHGIPYKVICPGGISNPDEIALVVLDGSPVRSAKDLEGQTIGVAMLKDITWIAVMAWLDQNGGDSSKVRFIEIPFAAMGAALKRGTVAAVPLAEPALNALRAQGGVHDLAARLFDVYGQGFMVGAWFAQQPWIEKNRDLARRFVDVIYATGRWANSHPDESSAIIAKHSGIDPAITRTMARIPFGESLAPSQLQKPFDLAFKYKVLDRPLNAHDVIVTF